MPGVLSVACKIPNGLKIRLFDMVDHDEPIMGGGSKTVKRAVDRGESLKIDGPATPYGMRPRNLIIGGYAITRNVDADKFSNWMKQNAEHPAVKQGLIFAHEKRDAIEGKATEQKKLLSGLEPLVPDKDERIPATLNKHISKPETADRAD